MTKKDFVENFVRKTGVTKREDEEFVKAFIEVTEEALSEGEEIQFIGFGTFSVKDTPERKGRNPQTGEEITIAARKSVHFKVGSKLKEIVNK